MNKKLLFSVLHVCLLVLLLPSLAPAWTAGLQEAAEAVARGAASPAQEMLVFVHNKEVNLLAQEGRISLSSYEACQDRFFQLNEDLVNKSVREAGFDPSISDRKFNPGTDTDVNVKGTGGRQVTLEDIKKIDANYQKNLKQHFKEKGLDPPSGKVNTETDFMPHPDHTDPDEFKRIVKYVNENGGTAYVDPKAASAQGKLGTDRVIRVDEASSFSSTMKDMADMKIQKANALRNEAAAIRNSNPGRAEYLEAQARQYDYQASKYHERIRDMNAQMRRDYLGEKGAVPGAADDAAKGAGNVKKGLEKASANIKSGGRNPFTGKDAAAVHNLHQSGLQGATDDMIDTLTAIARKDPTQLAQVRKALAAEVKRLPANRAVQAVDRIDGALKGVKGVEGSFAKAVFGEAKSAGRAADAAAKWGAYKQSLKNVSGIRSMTKISVVMTAGGALLTGYQGVSIALDNVKATDTLWDFFRNCYYHSAWEGTGIGPAFEQAQREEIERYMKEFEAGQSPSMTKHLTFTILKTGVYLGKEALIGVLYLPDTIWEYFTQEKEMEAYAAMQNELAKVMRQMVLDRQAFEQVMANMKKMGLHDSDAKDYLNCLCGGCGGSLGGFFNPGCTSDIGHGPCQCNGPLTIWKTPLPAGDKQAQYDCFNKVAKMRYDEARAVFDQWNRQAAEENAKSVQPQMDKIRADIVSRKAMEDEDTARAIADRFEGVRDLLRPEDADYVRATVGPYLENFAARNVERGDVARAVDNQDRALNKVGMRDFQSETNAKQRKAQYEKWDKAWGEARETFPKIEGLARAGKVQQAVGAIENLEYRMLKDHLRPLPPAVKDPDFLALKKRVDGYMAEYREYLAKESERISALVRDRERRAAVTAIEDLIEAWEHAPAKLNELNQWLAACRAGVKEAENAKALGEHYEKAGDIAQAIHQYKVSLTQQADGDVKRALERLQQSAQGAAVAPQTAAKAQPAASASPAPAPAPVPASAPATAPVPAPAPAPGADQPAAAPSAPKVEMSRGFVGQWETDWGVMVLQIASGSGQVTGTYPHDEGRIAGQLSPDGTVLTGTWSEAPSYKPPQDAGRIEFVLGSDLNSFTGKWGYGDKDMTGTWVGRRWTGSPAPAGSSGQKAPGAASPSAPGPGAAATAKTPQGWQSVAMGNVRFAVPGSWQHRTREENAVDVLHLYWEGGFENPVHGVSGGVTRDYARARQELPGGRVVRIGGADVLRAEDGPAVNLLFPAMDGDTGVMLVLFRGETGSQATIDAIIETMEVGASAPAGQEAAPGVADAAPRDLDGTPEVVFNSGNIYTVLNGPTRATTFTLDGPVVLALIENYHWNNGQGAAPGTIALRGSDGKTYGPWQAEGMEGMGGVPNASWTVCPWSGCPAVRTRHRHDPGTWAHNEQSGGSGFTPGGDSCALTRSPGNTSRVTGRITWPFAR
jgi:hypothetical protein